jgi:hypothetical protein
MTMKRKAAGMWGRRRTAGSVLLIPVLIVAALSVQACSPEPAQLVVALPALGAAESNVSVSGISSGAYMAGQFQFAHSDIVSGAAIIAGGPYGCSESMFADTMPGTGTPMLNLSKAVNGCMLGLLSAWGVTDPARLADKARTRAERGQIGAIDDVRTDRVYLFTGRADRTVVPSVVKAAADLYAEIGVPRDQIKLVADVPAGHAFVTENAGAACDVSAKPYVVDCDYDQAGSLLTHIYGDLAPRSSAPSGEYIIFDQNPFRLPGSRDGLDDHGVAYIPNGCRTESGCRVHIAFHGCAQNRASGGEPFIRESGFDRWADSNNLILLFPQVEATPFNPQGCWDWWGYTGAAYLTRDAPQIAAVRAMIRKLAAAPGVL